MRYILLILTLCSITIFCRSQPIEVNSSDARRFVKELPTVQKVLDDYKTGDHYEETAKQSGALYILRDLVSYADGNGFNESAPNEKNLFKSYALKYSDLQSEMFSTFKDEETKRLKENSPRAKWFGLRTNYETSPDFKQEIMKRYLSKEGQAHYERIFSYYDKAIEKNNQPEEQHYQSYSNNQKVEKHSLISYKLGIVILLGLAIFIYLIPKMIFNAQKKYELDGYDLKFGKTTYTLHWRTGIVAEASKSSTTQVYSTGGSYDSYTKTYTAPTVHSSTTIHDQIFIIDKNNKEHAIKLNNWDIATRASHELTMIWAIKKGKEWGPYIIAINHTTNQYYHMDSTLQGMFRPKWKRWYGLVLITLIFVSMAAFSSASMNLVTGKMSITKEDVGFYLSGGVSIWIIAVIGFIYSAFKANHIAVENRKDYVASIKFSDYK